MVGTNHVRVHLRSSFWSSSIGSPPMKVPTTRPGAGRRAVIEVRTPATWRAISLVGTSTRACDLKCKDDQIKVDHELARP